MGLIQKKDEKDVIDGIEVIGRGEGPDPDAVVEVELHEGKTAEDISGTTAAKDEAVETEPDPELVGDADEDENEPEKEETETPAKLSASHGKLFIAIAVVAVVIAAIAGYIFGSGGFAPKGTGLANLTEDQLDTAVATWSYKGTSHSLSAREAIESQYSLDVVKNSDGTYPAPSAQIILAYVQNQILVSDAESRGITVSDDEAAEAVEKTLGTSDWATIAKQYGTSEDQAKEIVKQQTMSQKLYDEIVPDAVTAPTAPIEPADGNQDTASKEYADYIIGLAGDEWDAEKGTWKSEDGTIASALKDQEFTADSATYAQAMTAYSAAYQAYQMSSSKAASTYTDYVNGLFADANLQIYGVYA